MSRILETAWYRFRATFGRRWGGYLTVLVLIGLLSGLAMGAIAGARRTLASPSVYVASRNPFSFGIGTGVFDPEGGQNSGYDPNVIHALAHLPHVVAVASVSGLNMVILNNKGVPVPMDLSAGNGSGSIDGAYFTKNKASVVEGRMPNPDNPREFAVNAVVAQELHLHVGQVVPFGIYTNAQTERPDFGTTSVPPYRRLEINPGGYHRRPGDGGRRPGRHRIAPGLLTRAHPPAALMLCQLHDHRPKGGRGERRRPSGGTRGPGGVASGRSRDPQPQPPPTPWPRRCDRSSRWPSPWPCSAGSPGWWRSSWPPN